MINDMNKLQTSGRSDHCLASHVCAIGSPLILTLISGCHEGKVKVKTFRSNHNVKQDS